MTLNEPSRDQMVEESARKGLDHFKAQEGDLAIAEFTKAIELDPRRADARQYRAWELARKGSHWQAWEDLMYCVVYGYSLAPKIVEMVERYTGQSFPVNDRGPAVTFILLRHPFLWIDFGNTQTAIDCLNRTTFVSMSVDGRFTAPEQVFFHIASDAKAATLMIGGPGIQAGQMCEIAQAAVCLGGKFTKAQSRRKPDWQRLLDDYLAPNVGTEQALEFSFVEDHQ